ncbi:DUF742 domain-containing protein [Micromonospora sp. CPCC 205371]|jgi:Protein of unknown function (DUF742)|nr:DUF742 domain-containing protein [Micromonospora sp. CPCC 205371]
MASADDRNEDVWHDEDAGPVVRPYAMTRGRTQPARGEFDLISLVVATRSVPSVAAGLQPEHVTIMRLCQRPLSVAEVAAHLNLPLGIVRVLLGDLLDKGYILAREPQPASHMPPERIFKAVINGLRSL